ncbi:Mcm10-like protein, partial [Globisporangium splendens]
MWNWNALSQNATQQNASAARPQQQQTKQAPSFRTGLLQNPPPHASDKVARHPPAAASKPAATNGAARAIPNEKQKRDDAANANDPGTVETFSGLCIAKRTIPAADVKAELIERKFIPLNRMDVVPKDTFTNETIDWVTIGVLSRKTMSKAAASGGSFMVWSLSDLNDTELGVFLFGDAYEAHWKEIEGSIVAVLNAALLPATEKNRFAFKVTQENEVVKLGRAVDFGICKGLTSGEARCRLAVNTAKSQYCLHHITSKFLQAGKGRQQLNNNLGGFRKNLFSSASQSKNISAGVYTSATPMRGATSGWHAPMGPGQKRKRGDTGAGSAGFVGGPMRLSTSGTVIQHAARPRPGLGSARGTAVQPQSSAPPAVPAGQSGSTDTNNANPTRGQKIMCVFIRLPGGMRSD